MTTTRTTGEQTTMRRLNLEADSATVSYRRIPDELYAVTVGEGATIAGRIADADGQLPPGEWRRLCVSTPVSIYTDLLGREPRQEHNYGTSTALAYPAYELKTVRVLAPGEGKAP